MWPALKPTDKIAIMGTIDPQSATTVQTTGWVDSATFENFLAVVEVGVISATGVVNATILQATSSGGAGAKALGTPLSIVAVTQAGGGSSTQSVINFKQDDIDVTNGFRWIALSITPSVAAALIAGQLFGVDARYGPAATLAAATQQAPVGP